MKHATGSFSFKREALVLLHGLEKFHHHCFACEVSVIMDYTPLVEIFKKDMTAL